MSQSSQFIRRRVHQTFGYVLSRLKRAELPASFEELTGLEPAAKRFVMAVHKHGPGGEDETEKSKKDSKHKRSGDKGDCSQPSSPNTLLQFITEKNFIGGAKMLLERGVPTRSVGERAKKEILESKEAFESLNKTDVYREQLESIIKFLNESYPVVGSWEEWEALQNLRKEDFGNKYQLRCLWTSREYSVDPSGFLPDEFKTLKDEAADRGLQYVEFDPDREKEYRYYGDAHWKRYF